MFQSFQCHHFPDIKLWMRSHHFFWRPAGLKLSDMSVQVPFSLTIKQIYQKYTHAHTQTCEIWLWQMRISYLKKYKLESWFFFLPLLHFCHMLRLCSSHRIKFVPTFSWLKQRSQYNKTIQDKKKCKSWSKPFATVIVCDESAWKVKGIKSAPAAKSKKSFKSIFGLFSDQIQNTHLISALMLVLFCLLKPFNYERVSKDCSSNNKKIAGFSAAALLFFYSSHNYTFTL